MHDDVLRKNGLKVTESRKSVLNVLEETHEPLTAEIIFERVKKQHSLDYSTVYRILSIFAQKNIIIRNAGGDGIFYYQLNDHHHSHYLVCSECHKRVPIDGCPLDEISKKLIENTGFLLKGHNLEFIGECPECLHKKEIS